ncbi:tRNA (cytidine(34)-2'-O)-methyltransferase [Zhongshania aliphaticivorans]|uniref:tRNA (cytidine(34)-2'-O)-methyltransferase n=1 Tax=Zhongshania aliphaticivorans TaxID=1470434 RepID=UPI0012E56022|nr:tRNA (cytidine(34)-2'-O)-methyltransferase [Zhongshania aliphaticivorans]CAA0112529.1 tRNA (cytidine(34)-2'-O)-methyltransferase [Zhongshania aliphaticivorans]
MFHIALHEPRIAPNTGNIIRLVANNGCHLHLIEPLGFDLEEKKLRRAGLDYADLARVTRHADYESFLKEMAGRRIFALTTKGSRNYADADFKADDVLLFGSETAGLPQYIRDELGVEHCLKVPMIGSSRSLNLSNTVALVSYEAWRQVSFLGAVI